MTAPRTVHVGPVAIGNHLPLAFICGPCQIESRAHALETAKVLAELAATAGIGLIYKSSFDKANRTSVSAQRGIGIDEGHAGEPILGYRLVLLNLQHV